jgi:hypothetical protein
MTRRAARGVGDLLGGHASPGPTADYRAVCPSSIRFKSIVRKRTAAT